VLYAGVQTGSQGPAAVAVDADESDIGEKMHDAATPVISDRQTDRLAGSVVARYYQ